MNLDTPGAAEARNAIEQVLAGSATGWNAGDLDRFLAFYDDGPSTTVIGKGRVIKGAAEIRSLYAERFGCGDPRLIGTFQIKILDIKPIGTEHAVITGQCEFTNNAGTLNYLATLVFHHTHAGWRAVHIHG